MAGLYLPERWVGLAAALALAASCFADFDAGWDARKTGDSLGAAKEWLVSAQQGDARAQVNLALLYVQGHGVPQDCKQALTWLNKAAELGNDYGRYDLGALNYLGICVPRDLVKSHMWFSVAAVSGLLPQAISARVEVAGAMTSEQVAESEELARGYWKRAATETARQAEPPAPQTAPAEFTLEESIEKAEELARRYAPGEAASAGERPAKTMTVLVVPSGAPTVSSPGPTTVAVTEEPKAVPAPVAAAEVPKAEPAQAPAGSGEGGNGGDPTAKADAALGAARHSQIAGAFGLITQGQAYERLKRIFGSLPGSDRQMVFLIDDAEINAFAAGGGRVYVTRGMMEAVDATDGVLAFVLAHDMAHNANMHGAKQYQREVEHGKLTREFSQRCRDNKAACQAGAAYQSGYLETEKKLARDDEREADRLGIQAAAEVGYHPDYAILAARQLRAVSGEHSKFAAFLPNREGWAGREERAESNYDAALAVFEKKWGEAEKSPGGRPPAMASLGAIKIAKQGEVEVVQTAVRVRNVREAPVTLTARLVGENGAGPVLFERAYMSDHRAPEAIAIPVTKGDLRDKKGKQYVRLTVHSGREVLLESAGVRVR